MNRIEQLWIHRWPSGAEKSIAGLRPMPEELTAAYGFHFEAEEDDLDAYVQVGLRLPSGRVVQMVRYARQPGEGTTIFVDAEDNAEDARRELLAALGADSDIFEWIE